MYFQKKRVIAMLLAGGQGSRLKVLTEKTAKPAVPFGGKYRIIDFPLSNCVNSGIDTVGILTQYQPLELNEYIGNGQPWNLNKTHSCAQVLPPYERHDKKSGWYKGTANAALCRNDPRIAQRLCDLSNHLFRDSHLLADILTPHRRSKDCKK